MAKAIFEAFSSMNEGLDKERKAIMKQWAKREPQIERVMEATVGMYGDLQGIAGKSLQEIEGLNLYALMDDKWRLYIKRSGVVLIDEIDAHLHPEWQREIGFWLKRHFPNIQFLVTTHSPIICQAADTNGLFVLPEPASGEMPRPLNSEEYKRVIASRPDTILLTAAFGMQNTRSPRAVEGRAELARLKAKKRSGARLTLEEQNKQGELQLFAEAGEEV